MTKGILFAIIINVDADVAELADALDLGSSVPDVKVQVLSSAPQKWSSTIVGLFFCALLNKDLNLKEARAFRKQFCELFLARVARL